MDLEVVLSLLIINNNIMFQWCRRNFRFGISAGKCIELGRLRRNDRVDVLPVRFQVSTAYQRVCIVIVLSTVRYVTTDEFAICINVFSVHNK